MDQRAAETIAGYLLHGMAEILEELHGVPFTGDTSSPQEADAAELSEEAAQRPLVLRLESAQERECLTMLLDARTARALLGDEGEKLEAAADPFLLAQLEELGGQLLQGAVSVALEHCNEDATQGNDAAAFEAGDDTVEVMLAQMPAGAAYALCSLTPDKKPDLEFCLIWSAELVGLLDARSKAAEAQQPQGQQQKEELGATLSQAELDDILGGLGGSQHETMEEAAAAAAPVQQHNLDMVLDIRLLATARLGRIEMPLQDILRLSPGSVIEVGHLVDEPVDLLINGKLIAKGDVVVVDERYGLRITEIVSPRERIESLR